MIREYGEPRAIGGPELAARDTFCARTERARVRAVVAFSDVSIPIAAVSASAAEWTWLILLVGGGVVVRRLVRQAVE
jgi:hypothetical protein